MELEDSREKGYLITSRAIAVEWDYGKRTVLLTSLSGEVLDASEVVKAYFDRWPDQELPFRGMKAVACLHRVAGYGKQEVTNPRVLQRQEELRGLIRKLKAELKDSLSQIAVEEEAIARLVERERPIRARSRIVDGRRIVTKKDGELLSKIDREIRSRKRRIKAIEKPHVSSFQRLRKAEREWLRLQGKEHVYKVDVELHQIMTFYRLSLVNLYSYLTHELFGKSSISMNRLVQTVLQLPALITETPDRKEVTLEYNEKDPKTMLQLDTALKRFNGLGLHTLSGKPVQFRIGQIGFALKSTE